MTYGSVGRAGQQFKELPLIRGLDGEDIDQRDKVAARRDRCHRRTRGSVITERIALFYRCPLVRIEVRDFLSHNASIERGPQGHHFIWVARGHERPSSAGPTSAFISKLVLVRPVEPATQTCHS